MSRRKIQIFTSDSETYDKYWANDLGESLYADPSVFDEGCGYSVPPSKKTIEDVFDSLDNMDNIDAEIYDYDVDKISYFKNLNNVFKKMGLSVYVDDDSIEYVKSTCSPIIAVDGEIISVGKISEVIDILNSIEGEYKIFWSMEWKHRQSLYFHFILFVFNHIDQAL